MSSEAHNFPSVAGLGLHRQVTRGQLAALGLDSRGITRREWLYRVHHGVYSVGGPPRTGLEHAAAALLACGDGAALSHDSAMVLWGMWKRWQLPIHVAVPGDRRASGVRVHKLRGLEDRDIRIHRGLRVISPARALLDMARRMPDKALKRRVNEARRAEILTLADIADVVNRFPRHPGAKRLKPLLEVKGGPTRSEWEDEFPAFCKQYGLPEPVLSTWVAGYEADALWPDERIVIELDSWEFHRDREAFEIDRDKDVDRQVAGYAPVRITWERITLRSAREAARLHELVRKRRARAA
jgi:hypothetical protein